MLLSLFSTLFLMFFFVSFTLSQLLLDLFLNYSFWWFQLPSLFYSFPICVFYLRYLFPNLSSSDFKHCVDCGLYLLWYIYSFSSKTTEIDQDDSNSNKSPIRCNNFPVYYSEVYLQFNMFRASSRQSTGAQWLQWQPLVLPFYCGDSRAVFVVGPVNRPDHEHSTTVTTIQR
jgi:hypothetical protein